MFATVIALPVLSIPAILAGTPVHDSLAIAAGAGLGFFLFMALVGAAFFIWDRPVELAGRGIQWLLNAIRRPAAPRANLPELLVGERNFIRLTFGRR